MKKIIPWIFGGVLLTLGLLLVSQGIWHVVEPDKYLAKARIVATNGKSLAYEDSAVLKEYDKILSSETLRPVVESLSLEQKWATELGKTTTASAESIRPLLRKKISIQHVQNTRIFEIRVTSRNPKEAADIANAVAKSECTRELQEATAEYQHVFQQTTGKTVHLEFDPPAIIDLAEAPLQPLPNRNLGLALILCGSVPAIFGFRKLARHRPITCPPVPPGSSSSARR